MVGLSSPGPRRRRRAQSLAIARLASVLAAGGFVCLAVVGGVEYGHAWVFAIAHPSNPHSLSYSGAREVALALVNEAGGGPWFVFYAESFWMHSNVTVATKSLYPFSGCGFPAWASPVANLHVTIPRADTGLSSGLSPAWVLWTGNTSGEFREVYVKNGSAVVLGDVPESLRCGYLLPNTTLPYPVLDSPEAVSHAWSEGGENFTATLPNATVELFLTTYSGGSGSPFYWIVRWSSCTPEVGFQVPMVGGSELVQSLNATTGVLQTSLRGNAACVSP